MPRPPNRLEREAKRQLQLPCEIRLGRDCPESAAAEGNVRAVEQRGIHRVQRLTPELSPEPFLDGVGLEYRHVPIHLPRATH